MYLFSNRFYYTFVLFPVRKLKSLEDWIFYFVRICMTKVHCEIEISLFVHLLQFNGLGNIRYRFDRLVNCSYEHGICMCKEK